MSVQRDFPPFSLSRLLKTVFAPERGEKICLLIDLPDPARSKDFAFLDDEALPIQRHAYEVFYQGLKNGVMDELGLRGGEMYAYRITGGSNLDLPDRCVDASGRELSLRRDVYPRYDIILCVSTFSATAPLTALAKEFGFRGGTLHGINRTIIDSGLSVDYEEVSRAAEKLRRGMTRAETVEIDFEAGGETRALKLILGEQEAQKSHGLCRGKEPAVANLPAGEIYYVPTGAEGFFPMKYEEGTLAWLEVRDGRIVDGTLISGDRSTLEAQLAKIKKDPVTGEIGELGLGTQVLPFSGSDIQDEKILGTVHVATGRSDHLGGDLTPDKFAEAVNATHDDILFSPDKTPEIKVLQVRMRRGGETAVLIEDYRPADYIRSLLSEEQPV